MKNRILIIVILLLLVGCSKNEIEEPEGEPKKSPLAGKWIAELSRKHEPDTLHLRNDRTFRIVYNDCPEVYANGDYAETGEWKLKAGFLLLSGKKEIEAKIFKSKKEKLVLIWKDSKLKFKKEN